MSHIVSVTFNIATDDIIKRNSFVTIQRDEINNTSDGLPCSTGVCDLNMGTIDKKTRCSTCGNVRRKCLGHRGHIELVTEYITPNAIQETMQWLKIICHKCGNLIIDKFKLKSKSLLAAVQLVTDFMTCSSCFDVHPKIKKDEEDSFTIWAITNNEKQYKLYPHIIKQIFSRILPEVITMFNKNKATHPVNFICKNLPVLPNTLRYPISNFMGIGNTHHHFTNAYFHIIKRNLLLSSINETTFNNINTNGTIAEELDLNLQVLHQTIYDTILSSSATNTKKRQISSGNKPMQSILRTLPSKKGLIRENLMGKRVTYTARSTISGNCNLKLNEIAIPIEVAQTLKIEEVVQTYNYEYCMRFFLNESTYPGCTLIKRKGSNEYNDITFIKDKYLNIGDTICRDIIDGDIALFNRQPTLKPSSMGVHYLRILHDKSIHAIQMNVLICKNYNADFDGDQMNIIIPRTVASRAESILLAGVHTHYISEGHSKPLNGQDLDSIIGLFDLTCKDTRIDKYHAMQLIDNAEEDIIFTGLDIVSECLRDTPINFKKKPTSNKNIYKILNIPDEHKMVNITNGKMISGLLDKASVGRSAGGLFHIISQEYGKKVAFDSIHQFQQLALRYMMMNGFTMSISDILLSAEKREKIDAVIRDILTESYIINNNVDKRLIIPPIGMTIEQYYEKMQLNVLKLPDEIMDYVLEGMDMFTNGFLKMVATEAKGSDANFLNICAAVGQQTIDEVRMQRNYCYDRIMAHCPRSALDAEYYGYCSNSYITGSTLIQFLNQSKTMRFQIIAKAMLTAVTGTFFRKGCMNNQNSIVDNNLRVTRDFKIIQYLYGEDGFNPKNLEDVTIPTINMNDADLKNYAGDHYELLKTDRDLFRQIKMNYESTVTNIDFSAKVSVAINVKRYIDSISEHFAPVDSVEAEKNRKTMLDFCENLPQIYFNNRLKLDFTKSEYNIYRISLWIYGVLIRAELTPKILSNMTTQQLKFILDKILSTMKKALIDPGMAVGILASQFICEPLTQGMLNSGHKSATGGSSRSGLVRFDEIYKLKNIEEELSASMHIPINAETEEEAYKIAASIEIITFKSFVRDCKIIVESIDNLKYKETIEDKDWINSAMSKKIIDLTSYCIRFTIDKSTLILKNVSMELIIEKLSRINHIYIVSTPETVSNIVIRIWLRSNIRKNQSPIDEEFLCQFKDLLMSTQIRGCDRVIRTEVVKKKRTFIDQDGNIKQKDKFVIVTSGSNLYGVSTHTAVIKDEFNSNSIIDTYNMLGVVAARNKIITETSMFLGENVGYRHFQQYADVMTRDGVLTSLERNGVALREPNNILLRMAYGSPIDVVQHAAVNGVKSKIVGPAAMQMLGLTPKIGTNYNDLILNEKFINDNVSSVLNIINDL